MAQAALQEHNSELRDEEVTASAGQEPAGDSLEKGLTAALVAIHEPPFAMPDDLCAISLPLHEWKRRSRMLLLHNDTRLVSFHSCVITGTPKDMLPCLQLEKPG